MLPLLTKTEIDHKNEFAKDVLRGLLARQKYISSKYFYNEEGSKIFQQIMQLEEYYLTRCEEEIFNTCQSRLFELFTQQTDSINIIELGAGDGTKTRLLLSGFIEKNFPFTYSAVDISKEALTELAQTMQHMAGIQPVLVEGEYLGALESLVTEGTRNVVLFLGSNIGNFDETQSQLFLSEIKSRLHINDLLLIGFDLQKDAQIILNAYNDASGVTKAFNLNLLKRINKELDADFNLEYFDHVPVYDQDSGEARSYIKSKVKQKVYIGALSQEVMFEEGESLHTEISRKYTLNQISEMALSTEFQIAENFLDAKKYFCNSVWRAI